MVDLLGCICFGYLVWHIVQSDTAMDKIKKEFNHYKNKIKGKL